MSSTDNNPAPANSLAFTSRGKKAPRRVRVAPPPGGSRPSDWIGLRVQTRVKVAGKPPGSKAQVFQGSHGGSGLTIRFDEDGKLAAGITEQHIDLL